MLPSHRSAHAKLWKVLAVLLPLILLAGAYVAPGTGEKEPIKLQKSGEAQ